MPKMLSKNEVKKISKKLGWSLKETETAIKEYKMYKSIVNHDELLRICFKSNSPKQRIDNVAEYLIDNLEGDIIHNIVELFNIDIFVFVLRVFNLNDFQNSSLFKFKYELDISLEEVISGSFIRYPEAFFLFPNNKDIKDLQEYNLLDSFIFINDLDLSYELIDRYILHKSESQKFNSSRTSDINISDSYSLQFIEEISINLIQILGFKMFEINCLKDHITRLSRINFLPHNKKKLKIIKKGLMELEINKNEITDRQYWFYYCLIEKIKEKGYKTKPASEMAEKLLNLVQSGSIRNLYYIKKKITSGDDNFELDKFIFEQGFNNQINKYLSKLESVK